MNHLIAALAILWLCLTATGCANQDFQYPAASVPIKFKSPRVPTSQLVLIGDTGGPVEDGAALFEALRKLLDSNKTPKTVVFLGDNIYPSGLPHRDSEDYAEARKRLEAQVLALGKSNARLVFVPGNHDWDAGGRKGWVRVKAQTAHLNGIDMKAEVFSAPANGCPGPEVVNIGPNADLIAIDTQWWLHGHDKPNNMHNPDHCTNVDEEQVISALSRIIQNSSGWTVVAAHHPLRSTGQHAGYNDPTVHLFGLRAFGAHSNSILGWIPIPIVGSLASLLREYRSPTRQDLSNPKYRLMRSSIEKSIEKSGSRKVLFAAGHDHNIQIVENEDDAVALHIISGLGLANHETSVDKKAGSLFVHASADLPGFVVVDFYDEPEATLTVYGANADADLHKLFSTVIVPRNQKK